MKKTLTAVISLFLGILIFFFARGNTPLGDDAKRKESTAILVQKVVDGDTIKVLIDGKEETLRLIGIDTPESVHPDPTKNTEWGKIASKFTKEQLEGREIQLELDVQERDRFGRLLAYVYLEGELFNEVLVREGWAQVSTHPPNVKYVERFEKAQDEAKKAQRGFWKADDDVTTSDTEEEKTSSSQKIKGNINKRGQKIYHCPGQRHYEQTVIDESKGERWFDTEEEAQAAGWKKAEQ